ncbi:MAG: outer membrane protein assembly factor BamD [Pseudomonadota bacterium]
MAIRYVIIIAAALVLSACGTRVVDVDFEEAPADQLWNEALVLMDAGDYKTASVKFMEIDRLHPHTEYGRKAQVMMAFASYSRGNYDSAIQNGRRFLTLYPNHEDAAYAQYIVANSYYKQIPDVTRDQQQTNRALAAYERIVEKWPESEYANDARNKVQATQDQLAGKEMEIGRYYLERHENLAAVSRFRVVVEDYQQTRHVEEALFRLTESYYALGLTDEAQTSAAVLGHNFPDSRWYGDAYALLQTGGFEPNENRASWISRTFKGFRLL